MNPKNLISEAVESLSLLLKRRMASKDSLIKKSAITLAYWIKDYVQLLYKEMSAPKSYRRYDRGSVVSVHLGFRIDHEEGGLHYAVVLDKFDSTKNSVLTVIPLTSLKESIDLDHLYFKHLYLGNEVTDAIYEKIRKFSERLTTELNRLNEEWTALINAEGRDALKIEECEKELKRIAKENLLARKQLAKLAKMKSGSIALVDQIITVSKLRIYDPRSSKDMLYGIKVSNSTMTNIDAKIKKLYIA